MQQQMIRGWTVAVLAAATMTGGELAAQAATPAPQLSVSGVGYAQWNYNLSGTQHNNVFDVTRTYLNFNAKFSGGVATRVTPDIYRNGDGSLGYRLKYGYVSYQPNAGNLTYKFGLIQTPWLSREEDLYDYRMQGGMAWERGGYLSSADFGLSADAKFMSGRLDVNAGVYNGETYKKTEGDQRKDFMARASYRLGTSDDNSASGGLRLTAYAGIGRPTGGGNRDRYIGMLSYKSTRWTLAAEYGMTRDSSTVAPTALTKGSIITAFGVYRLPASKIALIARVDLTDPNTDLSNDRQTRIIGGVSYQLSPNLRLLGDVDLLSHEAGDPTIPVDARNQALVQVQFTF
ncbi:MAG: hypothetical protein ABIQ41_03800 [Gemmatimonadales bacterium]